jgi:hypothetical protein
MGRILPALLLSPCLLLPVRTLAAPEDRSSQPAAKQPRPLQATVVRIYRGGYVVEDQAGHEHRLQLGHVDLQCRSRRLSDRQVRLGDSVTIRGPHGSLVVTGRRLSTEQLT